MMSEIYPEPPHLTVAVYSSHSEADTFTQLCQTAHDMDCVPRNLVEVAPWSQDFEFVSDLGAAKETLNVSAARFEQLVAGLDPVVRTLRAAYSHRKFGTVVVEYIQRTGPGRHPIGLSLGSASLGIPDTLWSRSERQSAYAIAGWSRSVLQAASSRCEALYGAVGVEFSLPVPAQLTSGKERLVTELFISGRLIDRDKSIESKLRQAFTSGAVVNWRDGVFFSGWAPFNDQRVSISDPGPAVDAAASALGAVLSKDE